MTGSHEYYSLVHVPVRSSNADETPLYRNAASRDLFVRELTFTHTHTHTYTYIHKAKRCKTYDPEAGRRRTHTPYLPTPTPRGTTRPK